MKYFIFKIAGWHFGYYQGDKKDLIDVLDKLGATIAEEKDVHVNDFGIVFDKEILTELDCRGYNKDLDNSIKSEVKALCKSKGVNVEGFLEYDLDEFTRNLCKNARTKTKKFTVLSSDGDKEVIKNTCYLSSRSFEPFTDFNEDSFWELMESHCGVRKAFMTTKDEFRKSVRDHYDNITDEQIEDFLSEEFDEEMSLRDNLDWFLTFLQDMLD